MFYICFIFAIPFGAIANGLNFLNYLKTYEIAECEITRSRKKRNLDFQEESSAISAGIEIQLKTFNKTFHLILREDKTFNDVSIQMQLSLNYSANKYTNNQMKFYEGVLKNEASRSSVIGYVFNKTFFGSIMKNNVLLLVEPINFLFRNSVKSRKVVIYKAEDLNSSLWRSSSHDGALNWKLLYRTANVTVNATFQSEGIDIGSQQNDLFCGIEIVADHHLYNYFEKDTDHLSAYLYFHAKYADKVFERTDFTMMGKYGGIRLSVKKISIYKSSHDLNYPMLIASDITEYLNKFVYRQQNSEFCLSVSMSYRNLKGTAIGEAFRPDVNFSHYFGGICQQPYPSSTKNVNMHFNVAVINLRLGNVKRLPSAITLLAFTHEIGHSFGSGHDDPEHQICSPDKSEGKYLMHYTTLSRSEQRMEFSPCSRLIMREVLQKKGSCLKGKNASCGNAIREGEEECDCGWSAICNSIDPCCTPSDSQPPQVGCTFKNQNDFKCSPRESHCCHENCTINRNTSLECYRDTYLCLKSFCDGHNPNCPEPRRDIFTSCQPKATLCVGRNCSNFICGNKGLRGCICWHDLSQECLVCCEKDGRCVPASDLGIVNSDGEDYVLKEGTSCNDGIFHCDDSGKCIDRKYNIYGIAPLHISLIVISVFATLSLGIVVYFSRNKFSLENLLLLRNHI